MEREKRLDFWSSVTLAVTLVLFVVSMFVHGFGHELLLEAGVFLVSMKLVIGGRKVELSTERLEQRLERIERALDTRAAR